MHQFKSLVSVQLLSSSKPSLSFKIRLQHNGWDGRRAFHSAGLTAQCCLCVFLNSAGPLCCALLGSTAVLVRQSGQKHQEQALEPTAHPTFQSKMLKESLKKK